MKTLIIEAVENCLDAKRELCEGLSNEDIRQIFDAFTRRMQDDRDNDFAVYNARKYFARKYGI